MLPQGERHCVEAPFHLAEEGAGRLHFQAVLPVRVSFVNCDPLTRILCLHHKTTGKQKTFTFYH